MEIILMHDHYDQAHLDAVKVEMIKIGAPEIKAAWMDCYNAWVALEGCHRLRAAHELGIEPVIVEVEFDEDATGLELGLDWQDDDMTLGSVTGSAYNRKSLRF